MNLTDISNVKQAVTNISDGYYAVQDSMVFMVATLVLGLLFCFMGFRLAKIIFAIDGAVLGAVLCSFVAGIYLPASFAKIGAIAAAVIGAVLVAYLFFHLYKVAVFFCCAAIGAAVGSVPMAAAGLGGDTSPVFIAAIAVCALLFGIAGVLFIKPVLIFTTGLSGFAVAQPLLTLGNVNAGAKITLIVGAAISVAGIAVQILTTRKRNTPGFKKEKKTVEETPADTQQYESIDETPAVPAMSADGINEMFKKRIMLRALMGIAPVVAVLASAAAIAGAAMYNALHLELALIFAFFCFAGKKYKALELSYVLMIIACAVQSVFTLTNGGEGTVENLIGIYVPAVTAVVLVFLLISAVIMDRRAHPKKVIRKVPIQPQPQPAEDEDMLDMTRPLSVEETIESMQTSDDEGEKTELVDEDEKIELMDEGEKTEMMDEGETTVLLEEEKTEKLDDDTRAFALFADDKDEEIRIFGETKPAEEDDSMAEEDLGDTRIL